MSNPTVNHWVFSRNLLQRLRHSLIMKRSALLSGPCSVRWSALCSVCYSAWRATWRTTYWSIVRSITLLAGVSITLAGCTPKYDWRQVSNDQVGWVAMFPDKPVEASRTFTAPGVDQPVSLTLRSARIDQSLFAVGWVTLIDSAPSDQATQATKSSAKKITGQDTAEKIRVALEAAMLANIQHTASTLERQSVAIGTRNGQALSTRGKISQGSKQEAAEARLWMRSLVISSPAGVTPPFFHVVEIIAVGPTQDLSEEVALQFIESLVLLR